LFVILACILLTTAIAGGTLLTYLYQEQSAISLRLCIGACTGMALFATFGFLFSSFLGLTPSSIGISSGLLMLPLLLLVRARYREKIRQDTIMAIQQSKNRKALYVALVYAGVALVLGLVLARNMFERADGIYTAVLNNIGDLPFHLQVISSFVYGHNIPVEDPTYAGVRFTYPVLADFLTAMLAPAGASFAAATWLQGMALTLALVGLMHHWTRALTGNRLAALLAPLLVIFSGGLGWWTLMQDLRNSDGGLITLLGHLPRDYTITHGTIFGWGNSVTTLLLPQRSFVFGLPLALFIFYQWWAAVRASNSGDAAGPQSSRQEPAPASGSRGMLAAGASAGLLPLIHTHGFVVVIGAGACLALLFRSLWKQWIIFFAVAFVVALPELIWLFHNSAVHTAKFLAWEPGWDHDGHNAVWFWFVNTGFFVPLLLVALLWSPSEYGIPKKLRIFYAPFLLWFIVPNLLKLSPWIWDNIKFLFYWYVASAPLVAFLLARLWEEKSRRRWLAAGLFATLTLSGALDILRVITPHTAFQEFDRNGITMARLINLVAPPRAVVLHAPEWYSPVFLTGRRSLLGYPGWIWSRGLEPSERDRDIRTIYSGTPGTATLLKKYQVDYVLLGPAEKMLPANRSFWERCPRLAQIGDYQLFKADCGQ
jgi:hypothetical protein